MYCLKIGPSHQYGIPLVGRQWQLWSLMLSFDIAFGCSQKLSHWRAEHIIKKYDDLGVCNTLKHYCNYAVRYAVNNFLSSFWVLKRTISLVGNKENISITQSDLVCLFCCFASQVNSYGHGGTVSSPNHTFSWAGLNKRLTSNSCIYDNNHSWMFQSKGGEWP